MRVTTVEIMKRTRRENKFLSCDFSMLAMKIEGPEYHAVVRHYDRNSKKQVLHELVFFVVRHDEVSKYVSIERNGISGSHVKERKNS